MVDSEVITFDCYGTLIDWETGIRNAFRNAMTKSGAKPGLESEAVRIYESEEASVEREQPHKLYREVLSRTALLVARKIGWRLAESEASFLAEALPNWAPFSDTKPALERLAKDHRLGILSNIDNDLLAATLKQLKARFDIIVTAQNVRSYKPAPGHFKEASRIIGEQPWIHVAGSFYHDIEPAASLGIRAVWVNRKNLTLNDQNTAQKVLKVKDLTQFADCIDSRRRSFL